MTLLGSSVAINSGSACKFAARTGDAVVPSASGTFPGTIAAGAPNVCIG